MKAIFDLLFPYHAESLLLFEGDSLHFDIQQTKPFVGFATGRGAGKFNVSKLAQLQYEYLDLEPERSPEGFVQYIDSIIDYRYRLLNAIYKQQADSPIVMEAPNKEEIQKIIQLSPLNPAEFDYLDRLIHFQRYYSIGAFLQEGNFPEQFQDMALDFNGPVFKHFKEESYRRLSSIYDFRLFHALEYITKFEYVRQQQSQEGVKVTYGNWTELMRAPEFSTWAPEFIQNNFKQEVYNSYYAQYCAWSLTLTGDPGSMVDYLGMDEGNKYLNRIQHYKELLDTGLSDEVYQLHQASKSLDKQSFNEILKQNQFTPLFIVFWSAQYAGASMVNEIPALKDFEKEYADKIKVIYVCVDQEAHKKMWAARIIDESWEGEHYFLPQEGNESTLTPFGDKPISNFCGGGATYSLGQQVWLYRK